MRVAACATHGIVGLSLNNIRRAVILDQTQMLPLIHFCKSTPVNVAATPKLITNNYDNNNNHASFQLTMTRLVLHIQTIMTGLNRT